jgi:flagellar hook protein FlgE
MLRSMFSGVSGLRAHQTMMDVVGNNIANVNTIGYKESTVVFGDTLSQLTQSAAAPQNGIGGTNPSQVGLGVRVNAIANNFAQGSAQSTGKSTDMMIQGDGFFVVKQGEQSLYTRAGAFSLDTDGNLVTPDGGYVQGWAASTRGDVNSNAPTGQLNIPVGKIMPSLPTATGTIGGNLNPSTTTSTTTPPVTTNNGLGTTTFTTYDKLGAKSTLTVALTQDPADATKWTYTIKDPAGTAYPPVAPPGGGAAASGGLVFTGGKLTSPAADQKALVNLPDGTPVTIDLSTLTAYADASGKSALSQASDGAPVGTLTAFTLNPDGTITGSFSNGMKQTLGQLAMATFNNPEGLEKAGGTLFTVTTNSGGAQIGTAQTGGRGKLLSGQLEMSNVDLSTEFTNLILAQRGFQANSKIISTSDEILQEVVNLKR